MKIKVKENAILKKAVLLSVNLHIRLALIIILAAALLGGAFLLYTALKNREYIEQKYPVYSYNNKANASYEVFLLPNDVFVEKSLGEGVVYIASLIDYIYATFKYDFTGDKTGEFHGNYNITAVLEGYFVSETGNKTLWKKEYVLQPETSFSGNDKTVSIQKNIPVRLAGYEDDFNKALESLQFNFRAKLAIIWNVALEAKTDKGMVNEALSASMEMPVNEKYFEIKTNLPQEKKGTIDNAKKVISPAYEERIMIYWIVEAFCAVFLLFLIVFSAPSVATSPLHRELKRIFKKHGSRMVAFNGEMNATYEELIEISSIDDLVKIADDVGRPILYKSCSHHEESANFYVIDECNVYMLDMRKCVNNSLSDGRTVVNSFSI